MGKILWRADWNGERPMAERTMRWFVQWHKVRSNEYLKKDEHGESEAGRRLIPPSIFIANTHIIP